jgi:cyclic-di-AMP phosphodiesterase PgpH
VGIFTELHEKYRKSKIGRILSNSTIRRILAGFVFFLIIAGILSINFLPNRVNLVAGQPSPKDIKAPTNKSYEDPIQTAEAKKKAIQSVMPVYEKNVSISIAVEKNITNFFSRVRNIQTQTDLNETAKITALKEQLKPVDLPNESIVALLKKNPASLNALEDTTKDIIKVAMDKGIKKEDLIAARKSLTQDVLGLKILIVDKEIIADIIKSFLLDNVYLDAEETRRKQIEAEEQVTPFIATVKQNEIIIREGEIITEEHLVKLEALGLKTPHTSKVAFIGIAILVIIIILLIMLYLYQYRRDIYYNEGYLFLLGLITIITLVISKMIIAIRILESPAYNSLLGYLIPIASASMLIAILLDTRLAIIVTMVLSTLVGILTGNQLRFEIVTFVSGIAGVYSVSRLSQRSDLAKAGMVYISSATAITIMATEMTLNSSFGLALTAGLGLGLTNGLLSSVFTIGALPYLETGFGITSAVKLLELSNPNHPLLKKLLVEAPGTYHHSIIVGNLAEAAANEIGGEPLLVRVGAYYHDIGKVKRPYFFIENQLTSENPHDKIAPSLSTLIVTSHIKDGLEMAKEYKLPQVLLDIIEQHHGKSLVTYFYHRATENDPHETIVEEDFRYEGPKPQSKEAALVMLADSVEAAVRSLQKPNPGRVEGLVRKIIKDKLNDGQLDECDLTFKDLNIIAVAFIRVLSGIYHHRIEYPENVIKEMERRKVKDAGVH